MIRIYLLVALVALLVAGVWGEWRHHSGWRDGRAALVAQQDTVARNALAKKMAAQQQSDEKAVIADDAGRVKTVTIMNEVIKYVKTPGRNVCQFHPDRVRIKSAAVDNANSIAGYDDAAVQNGSAGK